MMMMMIVIIIKNNAQFDITKITYNHAKILHL